MDDKHGVIILAILGILKLTLEILKLVVDLLEKLKAHSKGNADQLPPRE